MAAGAAKAGIHQQFTDVGGAEEEARVDLRRTAVAGGDHRFLIRLAPQEVRQVAEGAAVDDARGEVRNHPRVAALTEVEPETGRVERSLLAPHRVAVVVEERDVAEVQYLRKWPRISTSTPLSR